MCVCLWSLCLCVCLYIWEQLGFSIFQAACAIQRTRPGPTWLPLMFRINHRVVRACTCDCSEGRGVSAHTRRNNSNPWHPWLKPLITTQINSLNTFIHPFVKVYERSEEGVSEGQFTQRHLSSLEGSSGIELRLWMRVVVCSFWSYFPVMMLCLIYYFHCSSCTVSFSCGAQKTETYNYEEP